MQPEIQEKTRIFSQLTREIPEARRKAEKCYESDGAIFENGRMTKTHYYNHYVTLFVGEVSGCQCGAISSDEATKYYLTKTFASIVKLRQDLTEMGALKA